MNQKVKNTLNVTLFIVFVGVLIYGAGFRLSVNKDNKK